MHKISDLYSRWKCRLRIVFRYTGIDDKLLNKNDNDMDIILNFGGTLIHHYFNQRANAGLDTALVIRGH